MSRPSLTARGPERSCVVCGKPFQPLLTNLRRGGGKTCSTRCCASNGGRAAATSPVSREAKREAAAVRAAKYRGGFPLVANTNHGQAIRRLVRVAVRSGELVRPDSCEDCGEPSAYIDAHHEDYGKPLEVVWLCKSCHKLRHYRGSLAVGA